MAVMADFARMPTRQKVMLFGIIGLVLGLLYYQFVFKGLKADLQSAESDHAAKQQLNAKLEKDIPEFAKLKARMLSLKRIIDENQKALPTEAELPAFFDMLNRKVLESGVEVVRSRQGKEVPIESFVKVPIEYEIQGTFTQIKKFFASLLPKKKHPGDKAGEPSGEQQDVEEKERIVSIENLSLSTPVVRNREIRLTAKFVASTYREEEKKEAEPAKGAAPAKGATPAPATNPSPAAAGTPKGAKAQTEKAIDKGDQRNQNATGVDEAKTPSGSAKMKGGVP